MNSISPATAIFSFSGAARSRLFRSAARDGDGVTERLNGDLRDWRWLLIFRTRFSLLLDLYGSQQLLSCLLDLAPVGTGSQLAAAVAT
ncbi:hypothetical protein HAX54_039307 [Datura stramonium]|uniref:Uncharacterized protein n=1 Tax=Datura stramonium TaxID=4076 RepID=A0ABS8YB73_DATST|nr:hypothetical protein [Datura stramonium]